MSPSRYIAHFDGDSFFVSCEILRRPDLRGKPVVTGGERGVVTSLSQEAKQLGVRRGMPCFQVRDAFPSVHILQSSLQTYARHAQQVYDIVRAHSSCVEEYSIDECFAYVPDSETAHRAKHELERSTGLTFGVGVACTKTLAKVASRCAKPASFYVLGDTEHVDTILHSMPVEQVWGIGKATADKLRAHGIATAYALAHAQEHIVRQYSRSVIQTVQELRGIEVFEVSQATPARFFEGYSQTSKTQDSIRSSQTFHPPTADVDALYTKALLHLDNVCTRARGMNLSARSLSVFLRDAHYVTTQGKATIDPPTSSPAGCLLAVRKALLEAIKVGNRYRTVGVVLDAMVTRGTAQHDLFSDPDTPTVTQKREAVADAVDAIRHQFGASSVYFGVRHITRGARAGTTGVSAASPVRPWTLPYLGDVS